MDSREIKPLRQGGLQSQVNRVIIESQMKNIREGNGCGCPGCLYRVGIVRRWLRLNIISTQNSSSLQDHNKGHDKSYFDKFNQGENTGL